MKKLALLGFIVSASSLSGHVVLADNTPSEPEAPKQQVQTSGFSWLGVWIENVPMAVGMQLSSHLKKDQGVMIRKVSPASPAAKAGLLQYDVIAEFNDQKVFSLKQFTRLIRTTQPQTTIKLAIIRQGKLIHQDLVLEALPMHNKPLPLHQGKPLIGNVPEPKQIDSTVQKEALPIQKESSPIQKEASPALEETSSMQKEVPTLEEKTSPEQKRPHPYSTPFSRNQTNRMRHMTPPWMNSQFFRQQGQWFNQRPGFNQDDPRMNQRSSWSRFESIRLESTGKNKHRAEVKYKDSEGNNKEFLFEGSQEEIFNQITELDKMDQGTKQYLLQALDMNNVMPAPPFGYNPYMRPDWFNQQMQMYPGYRGHQ